MENIKENLIKLKEFIINNGWCQGTPARNKWGKAVSWSGVSAESYCLAGACAKLGVDVDIQLGTILASKVRNLYSDSCFSDVNLGPVPFYNDRIAKSKTDIINLIDLCIKDCEE